MIRVENVRKSYLRPDGSRFIVYDDLSLTLPAKTNIGILGRNGAGKSTLMRLLGGIDRPDRGRITSDGRISPPLGLQGGVAPALSGRENAKFVCRVCGLQGPEMKERLTFIHQFSQLGDFFEQPVRIYSSGMRARLGFAMSMAFDYDYYLLDEITSTGDERFRMRADEAFRSKRDRASIILVSHGMGALREWCDVGLYVKDRQVHYYDDIDEAIDLYLRDST
jgi:capsular polysaccharide transport system ATP-binding protein